MKLLAFGDIHYKGTAPVMRKEGYGDQILHKINLMQKLARKLEAKIICTGDLFDKKYGVTFTEVYEMMDTIDESLGWYTVLGNHDIQAYNQMIKTQPIGLLMKSKKIILLGKDPIEFDDGTFLTGEGFHTNYNIPETFARAVTDPECRYHIHVTHGMITEKSMPWDTIMAEDVENVLQCDMLLNGHYHKPYQYGERIFNIGSLARTAKEKNYLNKTPKALMVHTGSKEAKWIDIPCEEDVWKDETQRPDKGNKDELDEFVREMQEMEITDEDLLSKLLEGKKEEVKKKFYSYIGE